MVEKDTAIRALNVELARKTELAEDLKARLKQLMGAKGGLPADKNVGSNQEIVAHLSDMLKSREKELENQSS